jgi:mRNA-degrading endonuclease RelE of RelBE toxin-antitoxin system
MEKMTVTLHIRVSEETAAELRRLAEKDRRKLAPYIALVLDNHIAEQSGKGAKPKRGEK